MYGNRTHHDIVAVISDTRVLLRLQQVAWQRKKFKEILPLLKADCCQSKARQTAGLKKLYKEKKNEHKDTRQPRFCVCVR